MEFREFGSPERRTVVLLHGGGLSWWNYRDAARLLEADFRVILPVLDGHAGSGRPFTGIEDNAEELLGFIDEKLGGSLLLLGGLSLGAQVALEMLSRRAELCRFALIESASVIPSGLTGALIGPAFGSSYSLIRSRSFARLQARSLHIRDELFEDYYRDTCAISKADLTAFMKASVSYRLNEGLRRCRARIHVYAGGRETGTILRSARLIAEAAADGELHILPGMVHGDFSMNRADEFAAAVRAIAGGARP